MHGHRRSPQRALITTLSALALAGALVASSAPPASATTFTPSYPAPANVPASPSATALAPRLSVQVIDGMIRIDNPGGAQNFSAGQFGFVPTAVQPPVMVPVNPGMRFTLPPSFQSAAQLAAAQRADAAAAEASEIARRAVAVAAASLAAADTQDAVVTSAQEAAAQAGLAKEAAWPAFAAAGVALDEAEQALDNAQVALEAAQPDDDVVALQLAVEAAQAAIELARSESDRTTAVFDAADATSMAAEEALTAATELAESLRSQAERDAQAATDATGLAKPLVAVSVPAIPAVVPAYDNGAARTVPGLLSGDDVVLAAAGFAPGTLVAFGIHSTPVAVAPVAVDELGYAVATFRVPAGFTGTHAFLAIGTGLDGLRRVLGFEISVAKPAVTAVDGRTLAASGFDQGGLLLAGVFLVAGGGLLLARRRRAGIR